MATGDGLARFIDRTEGKTNNFDVLRCLLAVAVLVTHSFVFVKTWLSEPLDALTHHQVSMGELAVNGFFVISGFLITASWLRSKGIWDYFKRRTLRIYPGFLLAYLFCVLIVGAIGAARAQDYYAHMPWAALAKNMLLLNNLDKLALPPTFTTAYPNGMNLNGSLWTIKIEFECYILLALLGVSGLLRRRSLMLTLCATTFALYLFANIPYFLHHLTVLGKLEGSFSHLRFGLYFLIGATFYLYRDRILYDRRLFWCAAGLVVLSSVTRTLNYVIPLCGSYLLFGAAFSQKPCWPRFAERRDLSYGIYLYGWPIQLLIASVMGNNTSPYILLMLALPLSCLAAALSWHLVEAPCLSLVRKRRRPVLQAAPVSSAVPAVSTNQTIQVGAAEE